MKIFQHIKVLLLTVIKGGGLASSIALLILLTGCAMKTPDLRIYAVKYGESFFPEKYMYLNGVAGKDSKFTWLCYYVESGSRRILIDTGFTNPSFIKMFHITNYTRPADILKKNGINPDSITDIIITHGHFDHAGGIADYPSAQIIISSAELEEIKKSKYGNAIREEFLKRTGVTEFSQNYNLDGIFTIKKIGGHSAGSSVVYLDSGKNRYCFTGDEVYSVKSLDEKIPNGSVTDLLKNTKFITDYDRKYIPLTFHNPEFYGLNQNFIIISTGN